MPPVDIATRHETVKHFVCLLLLLEVVVAAVVESALRWWNVLLVKVNEHQLCSQLLIGILDDLRHDGA